jgi:predicted HTH transcriptional regulator
LQLATKQRKIRDGTKQAQVIEMLRRPEGASLQQIMEVTGWQMHTARSVLSRTIQKDLGIHLISEKTSGSERIYRVNA